MIDKRGAMNGVSNLPAPEDVIQHFIAGTTDDVSTIFSNLVGYKDGKEISSATNTPSSSEKSNKRESNKSNGSKEVANEYTHGLNESPTDSNTQSSKSKKPKSRDDTKDNSVLPTKLTQTQKPSKVKLKNGKLYKPNGPCPICPKGSTAVYYCKPSLNHHLRSKHPSTFAGDINKQIGHQVYGNCNRCGKLFAISKLKSHQMWCKNTKQEDPLVDIQVQHDQNASVTLNVMTEEMSIELNDARPYFCIPLQYTHVTWRRPLKRISEKLLLMTMNRQSETQLANDAFVCTIILPGLVQYKRSQIMRDRKKKARRDNPERILDFLNNLEAKQNPILSIYEEIKIHLTHIVNRGKNRKVPTITSQKKRCEALIGDGRYSTAMSVVSSILDLDEGREIPVPKDLKTVEEIISKLHPEADESDYIPDLDPEHKYPRLSFTMEELKEAIDKLKFGSAPGSSGWTFRSISAILSMDEGEDSSHLQTVLDFFNRAIVGDLPKEIFQIWATSRSVLIPKGSNGFRPLCIGECFLRLVSKMLNDKVKAELGEALAPHQLCVGIKGGAEIGAKLAQIFFGENKMSTLAIDIENAFGTISRGLILKGLKKLCPALIPFYTSLHSFASPLHLTTGELVGYSSTGVRQGDPMAMIYFAVGIHDILLDM